MVGGLLEKRSEVAVVSLYRTEDRSEVIEFSTSYAEDAVGIFIKYPQREAIWTSFIKTFSSSCLVLPLHTHRDVDPMSLHSPSVRA